MANLCIKCFYSSVDDREALAYGEHMARHPGSKMIRPKPRVSDEARRMVANANASGSNQVKPMR